MKEGTLRQDTMGRRWREMGNLREASEGEGAGGEGTIGVFTVLTKSFRI